MKEKVEEKKCYNEIYWCDAQHAKTSPYIIFFFALNGWSGMFCFVNSKDRYISFPSGKAPVSVTLYYVTALVIDTCVVTFVIRDFHSHVRLFFYWKSPWGIILRILIGYAL